MIKKGRENGMSFIENAAKPRGFGGRAMLTAMNLGHERLAAWGLGFLPKEDFRVIADCGCGGGATVRALLRKYPTAKVYGIDQSELCAKRTCKTNRRAIEDRRCAVFCTDVRKTTCVNGDVCDYAICGDKDPYCALHPEYCDEAGFRRNN